MKQGLYFIAMVPPEEIESEITGFKQVMAKKYDSKKSLNSPGHITLIPPFKHAECKEKNLVSSLSESLRHQPLFPVFLNDFGVFKPRVIYVNVENSEDWISLYNLLSILITSEVQHYTSDSRPFHPHATIASRDLRKSEFYKAWEELSKVNYERFFTADHICLLKHNGKRWQIRERIFFKK